MSSSLENTVFEADLMGLNEAAVLSAGSAGREGLEAAFSVRLTENPRARGSVAAIAYRQSAPNRHKYWLFGNAQSESTRSRFQSAISNSPWHRPDLTGVSS